MSAERSLRVRERETDLRVTRRDIAADGVVALTLAGTDGQELPEWRPGAHIDLMLDDSLVRQYSLCSSPKDRSAWRIGVLGDPDSRGGSRFVHDELHEGSAVRTRGPRNHFPLVRSSRYQFIAGGIGITPMLPMIESVETGGAEWNLLYGGRTRDSMAFVGELERFGDKVALWPQDAKGMLDLNAVLGSPRDDTLVYCCGPEGLLAAVEERCAVWPKGSLHIERFAPKAPAQDAGRRSEVFEVVCERSGVTVEVPPDRSIYDILEDAGVDVLGSCMEGVCGTCETTVIEGDPDHRDSLLSEEEKADADVMYICVSRSRSKRLVLDA